MNLETVLAAIAAVGNDIPAFVTLIDEVKTVFDSESDLAAIDAAMNAANAQADAAHQAAQAQD